MSEIIKIDKYIDRQKEIYNAYVNSNGKKSEIMPFVDKYSKEDKKEYTLNDVLKYLKIYLSSNLANEEDKNKYQGTKKVSNKVIFNRGKLLVQRLIESKGNIDELDSYIDIFTKQDDKTRPYKKGYLKTCIEYYVENTKNKEKINTFNLVMNLSTRSDEYDIELINNLLNMNDINKAVKFVKEINISKSSLISLRQKYKLLYPANKKEIVKINKIIDESFKMNEKVMRFLDQRQLTLTNQDKIKILKRMLEEYILNDIEDIEELYPKYNFNKYKFKETLKDAKTSRDIILINLIDNYYAKTNAILASKQEIIEKIKAAYENGINYGNGYRKMNMYDFYRIAGYDTIESLNKYANKLYKNEEANKMKNILSSFTLDKVFKNKQQLLKSIDRFSKNGKTLTEEQKELIVDYLEYANLPYTTELFFQTAERYIDNDLVIEEDNEYKMKIA